MAGRGPHPAPGWTVDKGLASRFIMGVSTPPPRTGASREVVGIDDADGLLAGLATTLAGVTPAVRERRRIARLLEYRDPTPRGEHLIRRQGWQMTAVPGTEPTARSRSRNVLVFPTIITGWLFRMKS